MKQDIFIHVGLPKTGTTFLQINVFPKMDINFLSHIPDMYGTLTNFILSGKLSKDKPTLISDENLYGNIYGIQNYDTNFNIASRIKILYPNAKIIVTFRNKDEWLQSLHKQLRYNPYTSDSIHKNLDDFKTFKNLISKDFLDFEKYTFYLDTLFDDVLVLRYEDLKNEPDWFIRRICNFINVPFPKYTNQYINKSLTERQTRFLKLVKYIPVGQHVGRALTVPVKAFFRNFYNR